ncbi:MAG: SIMPL domain-containing protein [Pseudomonadota bacterium]
MAQPQGFGLPAAPVENVVQLSATGSAEAQQDFLTISLSTTREGPDAQAVQAQLKAALDSALAEAKAQAQPGQLDVRTGNLALFPRYAKDGRINGWQGSAELILQGRDIPRIAATAGRVQSLVVRQVSFSLSREQSARLEADAQSQAIEKFKIKAADIARGFGFRGFALRELSINTNDNGGPRPRMVAMEAKAVGNDAAVPVEAGKATVQVVVSGSVQMR